MAQVAAASSGGARGGARDGGAPGSAQSGRGKDAKEKEQKLDNGGSDKIQGIWDEGCVTIVTMVTVVSYYGIVTV